jgi:SAM-dependent methyltransferase
MEWTDGLQSELDFWDRWYSTKGIIWHEDYLFRLSTVTEIQNHISKHLICGYETILDVGSGPLTCLGKNWKGKTVNIIACDALADQYAELNMKYGIIPIIVTEKCKAELLSEKYDLFDIIHAQNSIDHCENPVNAIIEMIKILKPGGKIILRHSVKEGENQHYIGLHQWNFYEKNGDFMISGKGKTENINEIVFIYGAKVQTSTNNDIIENTITF